MQSELLRMLLMRRGCAAGRVAPYRETFDGNRRTSLEEERISIGYSEPTRQRQLYSLIQYIAGSGDVDLALNYLGRIEEAVMRLSDFPYSVSARYSILKKQGNRVLIFVKLLVFYKAMTK
jgi:plasmid stabilization system protein ParE